MTTPATAPHELGRKGEDLAVRYLEHTGLVVLDRNWRCPHGELDLVLTDGRTLVICEVKTRTSGRFGGPAEAVTDAKAGRIRRLADRWQHAHRIGWCDRRFDILSVLWPPGQCPRVTHLAGVF